MLSQHSVDTIASECTDSIAVDLNISHILASILGQVSTSEENVALARSRCSTSCEVSWSTPQALFIQFSDGADQLEDFEGFVGFLSFFSQACRL
jgi:hypothetical protein